jgi:hypothetical protein
MRVRFGATVIAVPVAAACSIFEPVCTDDLSYRVAPTANTIAVGESFTPTAEFRGCRGRERLEDTISWSVADSAIARVDATTGLVTGRSPGTTGVQARGAKYGLAHPAITVTVE